LTSVDRLVAGPPERRSLALLAEDVQVARAEVGQLRRAPVVPDRLLAARESLLRAMESYAAELGARGLPVPRQMRDDLRLQRSIQRLLDAPRTAG
jgi:hypothetical protein